MTLHEKMAMSDSKREGNHGPHEPPPFRQEPPRCSDTKPPPCITEALLLHSGGSYCMVEARSA